mgnify:CR=1 FL=1
MAKPHTLNPDELLLKLAERIGLFTKNQILTATKRIYRGRISEKDILLSFDKLVSRGVFKGERFVCLGQDVEAYCLQREGLGWRVRDGLLRLRAADVLMVNGMLLGVWDEDVSLAWTSLPLLRMRRSWLAPLAHVAIAWRGRYGHALVAFPEDPNALSLWMRPTYLGWLIRRDPSRRASGLIVMKSPGMAQSWDAFLGACEERGVRSCYIAMPRSLAEMEEKGIPSFERMLRRLPQAKAFIPLAPPLHRGNKQGRQLPSELEAYPAHPRLEGISALCRYPGQPASASLGVAAREVRTPLGVAHFAEPWAGALWALAMGWRLDVFTLRQAEAEQEVVRRTGHTWMAYRTLARLEDELARYRAVYGDAYGCEWACGEAMAAAAYWATGDRVACVHRPDGMAILRIAGRVVSLFLEIDGWHIGTMRMRPRSSAKIWATKLSRYAAYEDSGFWRVRFPAFPALLIVGELSERTAGLLAEAVRSYPRFQMRTFLLDAEEIERRGVLPGQWERVADGQRAAGREWLTSLASTTP